ncbi:hypothetical protein Tco_0230544, partial [Tanacetum coccineum]
ENDDSEDEDNELPNLDHQDNPSSPRSEDLVFDPGISNFHFSLKPVSFALPKDE